MQQRRVFVTGGTGYLGRPLIRELIARGHSVRALVRPASAGKLPQGTEAVAGDALGDFAASIPPADTLVHLVGTPHPGPHKAREFREIDLVSIQASVAAAKRAAIRHLVYVSVAHPAPAMRSYIAVRKEGEALIAASGLSATILRPWYVLGPGHRWPGIMLPVYRLMEQLPWTREPALRLGLVSLSQMVAALVSAVENPVAGVRFAGVPEIRDSGRAIGLHPA
ncbi:MAG TPA: NAD(P)H-binding protein [Burkholderiales bacterium]|nr:NAD(P)H-binding protein [Burkholderiales bacterium]